MTASEQLTEAQQRRAAALVPRVEGLARVLARQVSSVSVDELRSAGHEGLVQAALRYDPDSGVPFGAFAHYRIRGAMVDLVRRVTPSIRRRNRAVRTLEATQALLEQAQKGLPTQGGLDPRTLRERVEAAADIVAQTTAAVTLAKAAPSDPDEVIAEGESAEDVAMQTQRTDALRAAMHDFNREDHALLDALYVRGLSMGEYAAELQRHKSTISRHHARLLSLLGRRMRRAKTAPRPPPDD